MTAGCADGNVGQQDLHADTGLTEFGARQPRLDRRKFAMLAAIRIKRLAPAHRIVGTRQRAQYRMRRWHEEGYRAVVLHGARPMPCASRRARSAASEAIRPRIDDK